MSNLSEEEKKAIWYCSKILDANENDIEQWKIVENLIDRLQKELEKANKQLDLDYVDNNFISKDKIKDKIKELIKEGNYRTSDNPTGRVHFLKEDVDYKIEILEDLLKEN